MKICSKCKQERPVSEFYKSKRDGYRSRCKPCHREDRIEFEKTGYYEKYRIRKSKDPAWVAKRINAKIVITTSIIVKI